MEQRRKELGNKIKEIRQAKGISREEVGFRAGISGSYVGMIERAENDFKISKLFAIADALNVELKDLF